MTEQFIFNFIPMRMEQLGFSKYHLRYRDFVLSPNSRVVVAAYNELFFVIDDPPGVVVESDYGIYDSTSTLVDENAHQHRGLIEIQNPSAEKKRIKFLQVIIVN